MNITSKTLMTMAAAMAITLTGWAKTLPGVAPMAPDQLAQWRAEETLVNAPKAAAKSDLAFYTGKPYDADLNAYVFPFRNYNPDLCRWTVADPSGFPDGANNYCYAPTPNMGCDPLGLLEIGFLDTTTGGLIYAATAGETPSLHLVQTNDCCFRQPGQMELCTFLNPDGSVKNQMWVLPLEIVMSDAIDHKTFTDYKIGDTFTYTAHVSTPNDSSGSGAIGAAIIAHERGHAQAFNLKVANPLFTYCQSLGDTAADVALAKAKYTELKGKADYMAESLKRANEGFIGAMKYSDKNMKLVEDSKIGNTTTWKLVAE